MSERWRNIIFHWCDLGEYFDWLFELVDKVIIEINNLRFIEDNQSFLQVIQNASYDSLRTYFSFHLLKRLVDRTTLQMKICSGTYERNEN